MELGKNVTQFNAICRELQRMDGNPHLEIHLHSDSNYYLIIAKSVQHCQLAAGQGHDEAQENLGLCYQYGIGTEINLEKLIIIFKIGNSFGNKIKSSC